MEFAKAGAIRPQIVGAALNEISRDPGVSEALFNVLETQKILEGGANITLIPTNPSLLSDLMASGPDTKPGSRIQRET